MPLWLESVRCYQKPAGRLEKQCVCDHADRAGSFDPDVPQHIYIYPAQGNYKSFRRGKPQLWLMLCMVCKRKNIRRVMTTAKLIWEMAELIILYNAIIILNVNIHEDGYIQKHLLLRNRKLHSSVYYVKETVLVSIPLSLPLTGEETPGDSLSAHRGLL